MTIEPPAVDFARITSEINEEVRRRRAAGDFPPGLERELDSLFARYAPAATGGDFEEVLEQAERGSFVHADVPTASSQRGVGIVKRVLRSLVGWYVRFLAQQVTAFAGAITRAVRLLGRRVDVLETVTVRAVERTLADVMSGRAAAELSAWDGVVSEALAGQKGRVLHAECGQGGLLGRLVSDGLDAYGVEPREALAMTAARAGLDVRGDDVLAHLRTVPDGTLGGLVLSGAVDVLPLGSILELADLAAAKLATNGVIVVLSSAPSAWSRARDPIAVDLAPGRPLHPETWSHLLVTRGFDVPRMQPAPAEGLLEAVPVAVPGADVLNTNLDRLNALLFAPTAYAVIAHRS
jgi:hypothetical protein